MPFMERLQSAMILGTPMYHHNEAHIIDNLHAPFYEAIKHGDTATIATMIERGFDIDFHEAAFVPPLIFAIMHRRHDIAKYLLEHGADVNSVNTHDDTALHIAIRLRQYETVVLLVRFGADVHQKNRDQMTPAQLAHEDPKALEILQTTKAMHIECADCFECAKSGNLYGLALTCKHHLFDTTAQGHTLLHLAIYGGERKMIVYLLNKGLDIDAIDNSGNTPLNIAVKFKHYYDIVTLLIERNATLDHRNGQSKTALSTALRNGYDDITMLLIQSGANIHVVDALDTPLTLAHDAISNFPALAQSFRTIETELMMRGAHVDIPMNHLRWTPLFYAVSKMQDFAMKHHLQTLIHLGAEINYRDTNGRTPLMIAASLGRYDALQSLVNNYADINLLDSFGWSALMLGVYYNHLKVVEFLLKVGADVNLSSGTNLSALKIAKEHQRNQMIDLLIEFGATEAKNSE